MRRSNIAQEPTAPTPSGLEQSKVPPKKPTKRIRISTACVNCRHKKIKCDGQLPCAHCEKFRTECVYPSANKPANQEYVETLENRLRSVESHLQGLLSRGWGKGTTGPMSGDDHGDLTPDDGEASSPYTPSSIPATPPFRSSLGEAHPTMDNQRHHNGLPLTRRLSGATPNTPNLTGPDSESEDTTFATDDSMQVLGLLMGNLKIDRDGKAQYMPRILGRKEHSYNDSRIYGSSPSMDFPDFTVLDWETTERPMPYTLPNSILTPKAIGALMDIYFNSVHTFLPVVHKSSFLTLCQDGEYRVPPFLLMAICAVAARHATDLELQEIPELANLKSHALYDHARALLDTFMDVPRLSTVQGLLLLAYYQIKEKRSGHFFRVRMYVGLATRMAMDMGLHRAMLKDLSRIELSNTGDSVSSISSFHGRPLAASNMTSQLSNFLGARHNGMQSGIQSRDREQQRRQSQERQTVIHQESRLAWLGCFFMDGLISSLMGQDYGITSATLDMPKLIQEAGQMPDAVQGATLIFWYHHLQLVQIYRRVCVFYRSIRNERVLTRAAKGADMHAIETSMKDWLSNLPAHLVYLDNQGTGAPLPSYYTLYLHRFFYSHKLLLYRPLIANKTHRGDIKDSNSPMAKCSQAATMLTQIGEIIFQNYSWPWPGCGLFAYQMLQAAEIHVFQMVAHSATESQSLYYRTMDLIKGYVSLAKLQDMDKDIAAMEEMVKNFLLSPHESSAQATTASYQQQHFVATPASDYSYASVMSPTSPTDAVQRMSLSQGHGGYGLTHSASHQHQTEDADMFSPLQTHGYSSIESTPQPLRRQTQSQGIAAASGLISNPMPDGHGFSMGFDLPSVSSMTTTSHQSQPSTTSTGMYEASNQLPFYGTCTTTPSPPSMNMFDSASHGNSSSNSLQYNHPSFLQSTLTPVGDLLGLGHMDDRSFATGQVSANASTASVTVSASTPLSSQSSFMSTSSNGLDDPKKKLSAPPPKPPKRVFPQSTGSSSSSGVSQSSKPPVPKKPARLIEITPPRWIAPRPDGSNSATTTPKSAVVPAAISLIPATSSHYGGKTTGGSGGSIPTPSTPTTPHASNGESHFRQFKVLQPQATLYGMGTLVNSLGIEPQVHSMTEEHISTTPPSDRGYYETPEHDALHYLQSKFVTRYYEIVLGHSLSVDIH
ncbi:hypothetical protein BGX31_005744 [Mortierella sp. GBA43]|nr:hypothetical protein BGX31_005744 [Mortierella sp. GBA43]